MGTALGLRGTGAPRAWERSADKVVKLLEAAWVRESAMADRYSTQQPATT